MLPISGKETIRYTPLEFSAEAKASAEKSGKDISKFDNPPVYLLKVPTLMERQSFKRARNAYGVSHYITDKELLEELRKGVAEAVEAGQQAELLEIIDHFELLKEGDQSEDAKDLIEQMAEIERVISGAYPRYAQMLADREYYLAITPIVAFRHFVKGIENSATPFEIKAGLVSEDTVNQLSEMHVIEVGWKIMMLMHPSQEQEKNLK